MPFDNSKLEGCKRIDSVRKVVGCGITAQEKEKMAVMCPNAEFIIKSNENKGRIQELIRSRILSLFSLLLMITRIEF